MSAVASAFSNFASMPPNKMKPWMLLKLLNLL
jgi:hypothetical protein